MGRTTMLAGAPLPSAITRDGLSVDTWLPAFSTFFSHVLAKTPEDPTCIGPKLLPTWRVVSLERLLLPSGFSQRAWLDGAFNVGSNEDIAEHDEQQEKGHLEDEDPDATTYLTMSPFKKPRLPSPKTWKQCKPPQDEVLLSQYLEQSFAMHDALKSSQVIPPDESTLLEAADRTITPHHARQSQPYNHAQEQTRRDSDASTVDVTFLSAASSPPATQIGDITFNSTFPGSTAQSTASLTTTSSGSSTSTTLRARPIESPRRQPRAPLAPLRAPHLLSLFQLPTASHLHAIQPQTMTVDLIIGILSLSPLRIVTVRRTGRLVGVLEMLVGDDTSAGFGVTFWVDVAQEESQGLTLPGEARDELKESLQGLRKGDVVLLRNVALSDFQKVVRGNSLGRMRRGGGGRGGNATSVRLLWRAGWMRVDVDQATEGEDLEAAYESEELEIDDDGNGGGVGLIRGDDKAVRDKTARVRGWTRQFVPAAGVSPSRRKKRKYEEEHDGRSGYGDEGVLSAQDGMISPEELPPDDSLVGR